jgi:hypothetical protein
VQLAGDGLDVDSAFADEEHTGFERRGALQQGPGAADGGGVAGELDDAI